MKFLMIVLILVVLYPCQVFAQAQLQWQHSYGGSKKDSPKSLKAASDDGFVMAGVTLSQDGDISNGIGGGDWWILKTNKDGQKEWEVTLGGSSTETAHEIVATTNGGYIAVGETFSHDGDISFNHGGWDIWMVKLNVNGEKIWEKTFGGSNYDRAYSVKQTLDQGYILCGSTASTDGDISQNLGLFDIWVIKTDSSGNIEWEKTYGGFDGEEHAYNIELTMDGGYIFAGETNSTNGQITNALGNNDGWVVKINALGELEWQTTLGGFAADRCWDVKQDSNGDYFVIGYWGSGDLLPNFHGIFDFWITKLDIAGNILWQKIYGGSVDDWARSIDFLPNGEMVISGTTRSEDGDIVQNDGLQDIWVIGLDSSGLLLWQKTLGGNGGEFAFDMLATHDNGIVIAGESSIVSGDITQNYGSTDFWIVKLAPETSSTTNPSAIPLNLYPNPAQNWFSINLPITEADMQIGISDAQSRVVLAKTIRSDERLDISGLTAGVYTVSVVSKSGQLYTGKLVKA